jgi:death on curing protein
VLNGHSLAFTPADAIAFMLALAAGELSEEQVAEWFRERVVDG